MLVFNPAQAVCMNTFQQSYSTIQTQKSMQKPRFLQSKLKASFAATRYEGLSQQLHTQASQVGPKPNSPISKATGWQLNMFSTVETLESVFVAIGQKCTLQSHLIMYCCHAVCLIPPRLSICMLFSEATVLYKRRDLWRIQGFSKQAKSFIQGTNVKDGHNRYTHKHHKQALKLNLLSL